MHEPVKMKKKTKQNQQKQNLSEVKHFGITDFSEIFLTIPLRVSRTLNEIDKTANKNSVKRLLCF